MHLILDIDTDNLNDEIIKKLIELHQAEINRYKKLEDYYKGKHEILNRTTEDTSKPNNKLIHDYPGYIVDTVQGYFMGSPVRYSSDNKAMMEKLQDIFDYNDEQDENSELSKEMGIKGSVYELLYYDEDAQIRFNVVNPENLIMVYDTTLEHKPLMAVRHYDSKNILKDEVIKKIEVYTKDFIMEYEMKQGIIHMTDIRDNYFGDVPVVEYPNNDERLGDFEKVITLVDAYDKAQSDTLNDIEYFADAYLVLKGMNATQDNDVAAMKKNRVLLLAEGGEANWLIKEINDTFLENYKKRLQNDIHRFSKTPNLTDEEFAGNLSGVAMKFKLWGLEQVAVTKERKFKKALQRRIELICNALQNTAMAFDYRDVKMIFVRNIPQNIKEVAEIMEMLVGILSDETIVSMHPDIEDPAAELEKKEKEQLDKVNLDEINLDEDKKDTSNKDTKEDVNEKDG